MSTDAANIQWKNEALLVCVVLIWGVNFPILKAALHVMPITVVNALRFAVSTLTLGVIYAVRHRKQSAGFFAPFRAYTWQIVGLGLLVYVVYQLFFIVGLDGTTSGSAALIMASSPLWTAVVAHVLGHERLRRLAWAGLIISLAGTLVVVWAGPAALALGMKALMGNLLLFVAAFLWGLYTTINRPLLHHVTPTTLAFFGLLVSLPILAAIAVPALDEVRWGASNLWVWLAIIFSGAFSTGIAMIIWNQAVLQVGSSHTAAFNNLVPFVALLVGYLLLSEPINAAQIIGGALIVGGLVVMRRSRPSAPNVPLRT